MSSNGIWDMQPGGTGNSPAGYDLVGYDSAKFTEQVYAVLITSYPSNTSSVVPWNYTTAMSGGYSSNSGNTFDYIYRIIPKVFGPTPPPPPPPPMTVMLTVATEEYVPFDYGTLESSLNLAMVLFYYEPMTLVPVHGEFLNSHDASYTNDYTIFPKVGELGYFGTFVENKHSGDTTDRDAYNSDPLAFMARHSGNRYYKEPDFKYIVDLNYIYSDFSESKQCTYPF